MLTDLTSERLDELAIAAKELLERGDGGYMLRSSSGALGSGVTVLDRGELVALIAMAKRTEAAERELVIANARVKAYQISSETMGQLADKLGRERDVLRSACATIAGFDDENPNWAKWRDTKAIVHDALVATDAALAEHGGGA